MNRTIQELFDLTGKTALVTGACGHLGRSLAEGLAEAGANVIVTSRDESKAKGLAEKLPNHGEQQHFGVGLDHKNEKAIAATWHEIIAMCQSVDILVNNAHGGASNDWQDVEAEQLADQYANATGYFLLARHVRNHAVERNNPASIINLGSMYGLVASYPDAYDGICSASPVSYHLLKGGILQMTRHLAAYWAMDRVRVNCLSPGPFPSSQAPNQLVERLCEKSPMKRMGHPAELKGAIVFLASDASSYMTGQNLIIDGGWTAW